MEVTRNTLLKNNTMNEQKRAGKFPAFFISILMKKIIPFLFLIISSCTHDARDNPQPIITAPDTTIILDTIVSYNFDIKPIMVTYCLGIGNQSCHVANTNQGANGDFTIYQVLKNKADSGKIALRVFTSNGGMPPSYSNSPTSLTPVDLQKLKDWVMDGAPNN